MEARTSAASGRTCATRSFSSPAGMARTCSRMAWRQRLSKLSSLMPVAPSVLFDGGPFEDETASDDFAVEFAVAGLSLNASPGCAEHFGCFGRPDDVVVLRQFSQIPCEVVAHARQVVECFVRAGDQLRDL